MYIHFVQRTLLFSVSPAFLSLLHGREKTVSGIDAWAMFRIYVLFHMKFSSGFFTRPWRMNTKQCRWYSLIRSLKKKDKQVEPREDCVYDSKAETLYVETPFNLFFWYPSDESVRARNADNWLKRKLWDKGKASLNNSPFFFRFSSAVRVDVGIKSQWSNRESREFNKKTCYLILSFFR